MKKRIGSKIYDTDTAELIAESDEGRLYRKRTRDRERFFVFSDGTIRPVERRDEAPETTGSCGYQVRVDEETHRKLREIAKAKGLSMSQTVKYLVNNML